VTNERAKPLQFRLNDSGMGEEAAWLAKWGACIKQSNPTFPTNARR